VCLQNLHTVEKGPLLKLTLFKPLKMNMPHTFHGVILNMMK
jgi:hypothetical protein